MAIERFKRLGSSGVHPTRHPIYVPSYDRMETPHTMRFLARDGVPFRAVVQPAQADAYLKVLAELGRGEESMIVLPESPPGDEEKWNLMLTRCWIMEHSVAEGAERHWQLDDNMRDVRWMRDGDRIPVNAAIGLGACEDFSDRYTNVAISGLAYQMFVTIETRTPYYLNVHVYSCTLVNNAIPHRWRLIYNDDTDICLQVLADGWCTVLFNIYCADKIKTMLVRGGNTDDLYQGDGRAVMSRALERKWPGVVRTERRYGRPAHVINWKKFDTPLERKPDYDAIVAEQEARRPKLKLRGSPKAGSLKAKAERWSAADAATD